MEDGRWLGLYRREPNGICWPRWPGVGAKTSEVPMAAGMLSQVNRNGKIVTAKPCTR